MASGPDYLPKVAACLAAVSTATLVWFGSGLNPWWPLLWFAPLPVLLSASRSSWWGAALTAFLAWLAGSLNMYGITSTSAACAPFNVGGHLL